MIQLIQEITLLVGTLVGAYTDYKTGYIYDWITVPMVLIGVILSIVLGQWLNIIVGIVLFFGLYLLYRAGKIGGGDVKLFTGIALLNPFNSIEFLASVFLFSTISAAIFYSIYYTIKYLKKKIESNKNKKMKKGLIQEIVEENKQGLVQAFVLVTFAIIYFWFMKSAGLINELFIFVAGFTMLCLVLVMTLQKGITKNFFEKRIAIEKLEEDEVISVQGNLKKVIELFKLKKIVGKEQIMELKRMKIKSIVVLRELPKFGPFIFVGVCLALALPDFFLLLFA